MAGVSQRHSVDNALVDEGDPVRSVTDLAGVPGWDVRLLRDRWITAELRVLLGRRTWRVGLTPVSRDDVALMLWVDDVLVDHVRVAEADVAAAACAWARALHRSPAGDAVTWRRPG